MARRREAQPSNGPRNRAAGAARTDPRWLWHRNRIHAFALAAVIAFAGCASTQRSALPFLEVEPEMVVEESGPLGGDALAQRKRDMQRAHRDMIQFFETLEALQNKRKHSASIQLSSFLNTYVASHLDPLLRPSWQSEHPELSALDANLRLVKAGVLIQLRDRRRAQETLDEIRRRFAGRESMLVEFPIGSEGSLADALAALSTRKWRG